MHQHKFIFTFFVTLFLLLFPINSSQSDQCPNMTTSTSGPYIVGFPPWPDWCILRGPHFPYEICIVPFGPFGQPRFITGTERQDRKKDSGMYNIGHWTQWQSGRSVGWRGGRFITVPVHLSTREQCNTPTSIPPYKCISQFIQIQ